MSAVPPEDPGWTGRGVARAAAIALVALGTGAALGYAVSHEPPPSAQRHAPSRAPGPAPAPPPVDPIRILLSPLHEGSTLEGFDLAEVHPIGADGVLRLVCRRARAAVHVEIALAPPGGPERFALRHTEENATPEEGDRVARALAATLRANVAAPVPEGLRAFAPHASE